MSSSEQSAQSDKFKQAARELECDEDEARWDERLKGLAKAKPIDAKPGKRALTGEAN